jgi:hypothetical protein
MIQIQKDISSVTLLFSTIRSFLKDQVGMMEAFDLSPFDSILGNGDGKFVRLRKTSESGFSAICWQVGTDALELAAQEFDQEDFFPFRHETNTLRVNLSWNEELSEARFFLLGDFPKAYEGVLSLKDMKASALHRNHLAPDGGEYMKCGA